MVGESGWTGTYEDDHFKLDPVAKAARDSAPKPTPLEAARGELGRRGIRLDGIGTKADTSYIEAFIREVIRDELKRGGAA